jgi:aminoglycoside 2'-N-acetyltransferase I
MAAATLPVMPDVRIVEREALSREELDTLLAWLERAYDEGPWRREHWSDLGPGPHMMIHDADGELLAHACVVWVPVEIGDRQLQAGYLDDVATRADVRGRGLGTAVVAAAQQEIAPRRDRLPRDR